MIEGFFIRSETTKHTSLLPQCGACGLYRSCKSPKMEPTGTGKRGILIVGEAPGEEEDKEGRQFVGRTGQHVRNTLKRLGIRPDRDCWFTNAAICRPPKNKLPDKSIGYCQPTLTRTIRELKPTTIILLGGSAVRSLIGSHWPEQPGSMQRWAGWTIPDQVLNTWICPTYHPSYLLRENNPVLDMYWEDHLKKAVSLQGIPWKTPPNYASKVESLIDPDEAAIAIKHITNRSIPVAIDLETDRLKPDNQDAAIISCAISNGRRTISFPWVGRAIAATKRLLMSEVGKIGYNIRFEERWFIARLGINVRNWIWDGMLTAHTLDNRQGICGLDFQAYVLLGQRAWDAHVRPYMNSKGSNEPNRLREVDLSSLLLYGGLDSLLEWKIAYRQAKQMGIRL